MIHKFKQGADFILLDVESGAVHIVDEMIFDILETFTGANDAEVISALAKKYPPAEISEALAELHELIDVSRRIIPCRRRLKAPVSSKVCALWSRRTATSAASTVSATKELTGTAPL